MTDLRREARAASRGGDTILSQLRRVRDRILNPQVAAARLFCDPETGRFRAGAVEWLEMQGRRNFMRGTTFVPGDRDQTLINEGRRQAIQEIYDDVLLDGERLDEINAQIREIERNDR